MGQRKIRRNRLSYGICLLIATVIFGETTTEGAFLPIAGQRDLLQVKVHRLIVDPKNKQPVVSLADSGEQRALLIWIDFFEARAIHSEMQGIQHRRPLTHDLLERVIQKVNGKIHHIVITHTEDNIFFATLVIKRKDALVKIDARPSDSIVMALKFDAPIFVSKTLFNEMAIPVERETGLEEAEYGLILQDLTPSLAKYLSFDSDRGVLVSGVKKGSRAEKDGIAEGDIFIEVAGQVIENVSAMKAALEKSKPSVKARIFRNSRYLSITLHPN
jgi:bifunctional DNase/RNase